MRSGIKKWLTLLCLVLAAVMVAGCALGDEQEKELLTKAQSGDAEAQYQLSRIYFEGNGVDQSDKKGAIWVRKSAEQGHAMAMADLGLMYASGVMCRKDAVEADKWLTLSSRQGYGQGTRFMKDLEDTMTPADIEKAKKLADGWTPKR
jgi:uncharacterized protein